MRGPRDHGASSGISSVMCFWGVAVVYWAARTGFGSAVAVMIAARAAAVSARANATRGPAASAARSAVARVIGSCASTAFTAVPQKTPASTSAITSHHRFRAATRLLTISMPSMQSFRERAILKQVADPSEDAGRTYAA